MVDSNNKPTIGNGKICYLEIPTQDIERSMKFYEAVFGWNTRKRGDGNFAFDDGVGEVSGTWVKGTRAFECTWDLDLHHGR